MTRLAIAIVAGTVLASGCGDRATTPAYGALFEVRVQADAFTVRAEDDAAIEVCDGTPSMVEGNLEYWLDTVGMFCPWSARVIRRVD